MTAKAFDLEPMAQALSDVLEKTLKQLSQGEARERPELKKKNVIDFEGRLRAAGLEIFNRSMYVAVLSFYENEKLRADHRACGALIFYAAKDGFPAFLKSIGRRDFDDEDDGSMLKQCTEFCDEVAKDFIREVARLGFVTLTVPGSLGYINSVPGGIDYGSGQYEMYQLDLKLKGERALAFDLTLSALPRAH